eukprot:Nitzschia sp. Nitz4//scaffold406_size10313//4764//5560//NITZ4_009075-RA/size10313-augustus-gene-0.9-mRNA-1//1//CDS//3329551125//6906//frame0
MKTPISASKQHKRKGDTVFEERTTSHVVVVDGNKEDPALQMTTLQKQLVDLREEITKTTPPHEDPILKAFQSVSKQVESTEKLDLLLTESVQAQAQLDAQIEQAKEACQHETSALEKNVNQLRQLEKTRDTLVQNLDEMDERQVQLQAQIALHQEEASQEIEIMQDVDEQRKREVPRLKTQISLYASTTHIKWDFMKENVLAGTVALPQQKQLKQFSIDPRDYSPVETANRLWSLIEGQ